MFLRWQSAGRLAAILTIALGLCGSADAVAPVGTAKRVDQDPGGTPIYAFGNFFAARTGAGGFSVGWEENTKAENPTVFERVLFRVFNGSFAPVAAAKAANVAGRRVPAFARLVPLNANNAYLVYTVTRSNANPDHPELREAFGQTIALANGAPSGPRRLLNSSGNWDSLIALAAGVSNGRAVTAWYETDAPVPAPGRFVNSAGVPQPINLDFACCPGATKPNAQLIGLFPLGTGFVAAYLRNSIFGGNNGLHGRIFNANGQPAGAAKFITPNTLNPILRALSNNRIAVFSFEPVGNPTAHYKLVAQLYDQNWVKIGAAKTLIANVTSTKYPRHLADARRRRVPGTDDPERKYLFTLGASA